MQILGRILAVLAAALVVVGVTFGLAHTSYAQSAASARRQRPVLTQSTDSASAGSFEGERHHEGSRSPSLSAGIELVGELAIIAVIIGIVSLIKWALPSRQRKGKARGSNAPPASAPSA